MSLSCYLCCGELFVFAVSPLDYLCFLEIGDAFGVTLKTVFGFSILGILPILSLHGWGFFAPGLKHAERVRLGCVLAALNAWLMCCLYVSNGVSTMLFAWFLSYSWTTGSLVVQYMPIIPGFLWFKLKCFLCLALSLPVLACMACPRHANRGGHVQPPKKAEVALNKQPFGQPLGLNTQYQTRRGYYSVAILIGALFAVGASQFVVTFCVISLYEVMSWCFYAYPYWSKGRGDPSKGMACTQVTKPAKAHARAVG